MATKHYPDGDYTLTEALKCLDKDFASEKEMCDYLEQNIDKFCVDILGLEYKSHKREYRISGRGSRAKKIDFFIQTMCGQNIAVEAKNPTFAGYELASAIGQVLGYICLFESVEQKVDRVVLLSSKIDWVIPATIARFNLPIHFVALDKSKHLSLKVGQNGQ